MFYSFCWWLCMIWIRVMYHVEIVGRENVPRDRGYILAANHRTNMDPIFVAAGVRAPIRYGEGGAVPEGETVFLAAPQAWSLPGGTRQGRHRRG